MEGPISRSCTRYIKDQVKVYLQTHLLMQGFIFEKVLANNFITQELGCFEETNWGLPDSPSAVAEAHSHTLFAERYSRHENIPNPNTSFVTTP
jgi:hypothetical protein